MPRVRGVQRSLLPVADPAHSPHFQSPLWGALGYRRDYVGIRVHLLTV